MTTLFEPTHAGDIALANRIAMAPLTRNRAPDAIPTALMAQYYAQRASAGLLVSEGIAISPQGQGYADVPGLYSTEQLDGWKQVTERGAQGRRQDRRAAVACGPRLAHRAAAGQWPPVAPFGGARQDQDRTHPRRRAHLRRHLRAARARRRRAARHRARLPARRTPRHRQRVRWRRNPRRQWLPDRPVPQDRRQPARGRLRRQHQEPRPPALEVVRAVADEIGGRPHRHPPLARHAGQRHRATTTRSSCSTTCCTTWRRWAWPTSTSSKAPPAARANCPSARSTTPPSRPSTAAAEARAPGW